MKLTFRNMNHILPIHVTLKTFDMMLQKMRLFCAEISKKYVWNYNRSFANLFEAYNRLCTSYKNTETQDMVQLCRNWEKLHFKLSFTQLVYGLQLCCGSATRPRASWRHGHLVYLSSPKYSTVRHQTRWVWMADLIKYGWHIIPLQKEHISLALKLK